MSIQDNFRLAMRRYVYSVSILSNKDSDGNSNAITVSSVTSISMDPPSLLVCINKNSRIHNSLTVGSKFCINLLNKEDCSLVIGSKYLQDSNVKYRPVQRRIISKVLTIICKIIFDSQISDYTNTFRFYNVKLVKDFINRKMIFKSPIGHLDNLLYMIKKKYKIREISTEYIEYNSTSTVKLKFMLRYLIEFFKCIFKQKFL